MYSGRHNYENEKLNNELRLLADIGGTNARFALCESAWIGQHT
jgi:glucokinase